MKYPIYMYDNFFQKVSSSLFTVPPVSCVILKFSVLEINASFIIMYIIFSQ